MMQLNNSNSGKTEISVVIVCNGSRFIAHSLGVNAHWFRGHSVEIIGVVCGCSGEELLGAVSDVAHLAFRAIEIQTAIYNRALAINVGLYYARSEKCLILSCEHILRSDIIADSLSVLNGSSYLTADRIFLETTAGPQSSRQGISRYLPSGQLASIVKSSTMQAVYADGAVIDVASYYHDLWNDARSGSSVLAADKDQLIKVGGYNSELGNSLWANVDIQLRLKRILGLAHFMRGDVVQLENEADTGSLSAGARNGGSNAYDIMLNSILTSNLCGTYSQDLEEWIDKIRVSDAK